MTVTNNDALKHCAEEETMNEETQTIFDIVTDGGKTKRENLKMDSWESAALACEDLSKILKEISKLGPDKGQEFLEKLAKEKNPLTVKIDLLSTDIYLSLQTEHITVAVKV